MNNLCDECETVNHCLKHGCIPKQPVQEPIATLDEIFLDFIKKDTP